MQLCCKVGPIGMPNVQFAGRHTGKLPERMTSLTALLQLHVHSCGKVFALSTYPSAHWTKQDVPRSTDSQPEAAMPCTAGTELVHTFRVQFGLTPSTCPSGPQVKVDAVPA